MIQIYIYICSFSDSFPLYPIFGKEPSIVAAKLEKGQEVWGMEDGPHLLGHSDSWGQIHREDLKGILSKYTDLREEIIPPGRAREVRKRGVSVPLCTMSKHTHAWTDSSSVSVLSCFQNLSQL